MIKSKTTRYKIWFKSNSLPSLPHILQKERPSTPWSFAHFYWAERSCFWLPKKQFLSVFHEKAHQIRYNQSPSQQTPNPSYDKGTPVKVGQLFRSLLEWQTDFFLIAESLQWKTRFAKEYAKIPQITIPTMSWEKFSMHNQKINFLVYKKFLNVVKTFYDKSSLAFFRVFP